jgi:hypothetical protein
MEKWFCIWQISDNPKNCLYLARPSPTSNTLTAIFAHETAKSIIIKIKNHQSKSSKINEIKNQ